MIVERLPVGYCIRFTVCVDHDTAADGMPIRSEVVHKIVIPVRTFFRARAFLAEWFSRQGLLGAPLRLGFFDGLPAQILVGTLPEDQDGLDGDRVIANLGQGEELDRTAGRPRKTVGGSRWRQIAWKTRTLPISWKRPAISQSCGSNEQTTRKAGSYGKFARRAGSHQNDKDHGSSQSG
jgi:hypothetical protein